jgi:Domain of unknown function (DUF5666)
MKRLLSVIPVVMVAALLAACGSTSATETSNSTASTPTTKTTCPSVAIGTIQNVSTNSLQVTNLQGKQAHVTFTSATTFIRTSTIKPSGIQTDSLASVTIMQNANNTYSALSVSIRNPQIRQGSFTRGSSQCRSQFTRGNGTPGAFSGGQNRQIVNGTISQISGNALTLSNSNGDDFIVNLTPTTRITTQVTISPSALKSGEAIMITGLANGQGVINASSVAILQSLPRLRPTATPNA